MPLFHNPRRRPPRDRFRPRIEALEDRRVPAVFQVTSLADSDAAGSGSLRAAISASNATPGPNEIDILTAGTYALTLSGPATDNSAGELVILNNNVTIVNKSGGNVVIDAGGLATPARVFDVAPSGPSISVTLTGLIIQGGNAPGDGGGIQVGGASTLTLNNDLVQDNQAGSGGGIATDGPLMLNDTRVSDNSSSNVDTGGGGIYQSGAGALTINDSLFDGNQCSGSEAGGGGLLIASNGAVTISDSEFSSNTAHAFGGGLADLGGGTLTVARCTFNGNSGGDGGGLVIETSGTLSNTTVSGNVAGQNGGGISADFSGQVVLQNCTIADNQAGETAGGIFAGTEVELSDTAVADNHATAGDPDVDDSGVAANLVDEVANFIGDNTGAAASFLAGIPNAHGSWVGTGGVTLDPLLEPLADNGGTLVLPDGSHLLTQQDDANQGINGLRARALGGLPTDERGFPVADGARDIGAFEFQEADLAVSLSGPDAPLHLGRPAIFTFTVSNDGPNPSRDARYTAIFNSTDNEVEISFPVPDLAPGASYSFTLPNSSLNFTVPLALGRFTVTFTVSGHDDPNQANNTAALSYVVLPQPFDPPGLTDVTSLVQFVSLVRRRRPQRRVVLLLTNVSGVPLQGPLGVVVAGLPRSVKLRDAAGRTRGRQPFVLAGVGGQDILDPGAAALVELVFSQPFSPRKLRVLAGAFT